MPLADRSPVVPVAHFLPDGGKVIGCDGVDAVMSVGDGYKYLLHTFGAGGRRPVTVNSADPLLQRGRHFTRPWLGSGLPALGTGQIASGDEVSEAQLQLLVRMGRDPVTGASRGRAYPVLSGARP